jgi:sec-independent protein translocase protein TatB
MLENLSWAHILVLLVAGLFILGPERLPEAAAWLGRTIRQVKDFAAGTREQLSQELGPEFDQLRKPMEELRGPLRELRNLDPRRSVMTTLFDDRSALTANRPIAPTSTTTSPGDVPPPEEAQTPSAVAPNPPPRPLSPGERPPIDPDAT